MSDSEIERLEREIAERQERLAVLNVMVTREQLAAMSPTAIAKLDPAVVNRVMAVTA